MVITEVNSVAFGALGSHQQLGTLRQVSLHAWKEDSLKDGRDRFTMTETGRDQWSIYLFDLSRKVSLQIDLFDKVIYYSDPKQPRRQQYHITGSSTQPSGWLVNRVEYNDGPAKANSAFKQVSATGWTEDRPDGSTAYSFVETGRDDGSVHLLDPARKVTIQLDLSRAKIVYQEIGGARRDLYDVLSALTKVNGWLVNRVDYTAGRPSIAGSFVQTGAKAWVETSSTDDTERFEFQETNRDEWSVYLHDASRNVSLQVDLFKATVFYTDAKTPRFALYPIAHADILPKLGLDNGATVNVVTYGDTAANILGHFRQTSEQTWSESKQAAGAPAFQFDEIARDDWSVYLHDDSRDTWVQLDLYRNKISTHQGSAAPSDLYDILNTASALNGWLVNIVGYDTAPGKPEVLRQVGWAAWIEYQAGSTAIANHFDETGRDDWSVYLHDPSRNVKLQIDLSRKKILYSDTGAPPRDLYDILAKGHAVEPWRLPHRITSRSSLTQDFDPQPGGKPPLPRPVYRCSISFPLNVTSVEIWASEEVTLTINEVSYTLDRVKTARVVPSALSKLAVSIPATTIGCATLFLRTNLMQAGDFHIVTPDVEAHRKINDLKPGAMYDARSQLGISPRFDGKPDDVAAVQAGIQNLVSTIQYSYNDTYHGVHRDRAVLPANMDDSHFSLDFSGGGAKYTALTKQQVATLTQGARRIQPGAAQGFLDDVGNWLSGAATVIVHTADALGTDIVQTGEATVGVAKQAISAVGEDIVHGDLVGVVGDLMKGGENLGTALAHGAATAAGTIVEGAGQVLMITVTFAEAAAKDAIQFVADAVDYINNLIAPLLDQLGTALGEFLGWLLDKVGWQDVMHTHDVLLDAMNRQMDKGVTFFTTVKAKADNFFSDTAKKLDTAIDHALSDFGVQPTGLQPVTPAAFSGAVEQLESLMGKAFGAGNDAGFALAGLPLLGGQQSPLNDLIKTLEDKLGNDGATIVNALGDAIEHVRRMFNDPQRAPNEFMGVLLEIARAVGHIGLDIVSAVVDLLLDAIIAALPRVKAAANAEITIPFVSAFYQGLTGGRKLTPLSLAALLMAIPTTILNNALHKKPPFAAIGVAQSDSADMILTDSVKLTDDEIAWGYVYGSCQLVQSVTSAIADTTAFSQKRAEVKELKKVQMRTNADPALKDVPDDPDEFQDFPDEEGGIPMQPIAPAGAAANPAAAVPGDNDPWGIRPVQFPDMDDAPKAPKMAELSKLQTVLGVINLGANVLSLVAGAPMPPESFQDMSFVNAESVADPFEAPAYFSQVAFYFSCATTAIDAAVFSATTAATANGITQAAMDQFQKYMGILNFARGLARFGLMITVYVFDDKKQTALTNSGLMTDATFLQSVKDDPITALTNLRTRVMGNDNNSPVLPPAGQAVDGTTVVKAKIYLSNLLGYYNWALGPPLGISVKTFGNCMDAFPEIGQLGTLPAIVEASEGWSLLVTALFDTVAHLAEGITYCVRTNVEGLY